MKPKSCENCKNAVMFEDRSVGIGLSLDDCKADNPAIEPLLEEDLTMEQLAEKCPAYDPVMVEKCGECGKAINKPYYEWPLFVYLWDEMPLCSEECKAKVQAKIDKDVKETMRDAFYA